MIPKNVNWVITRVISYYNTRILYLDVSGDDVHDELTSNTFILPRNSLEGFIGFQKYASIEVYNSLQKFSVGILNELLKLLIPTGKFLLFDTEENRSHLSSLDQEILKHFNIRIEQDPSHMSSVQALLRSKNEIKTRLDEEDGQEFLKLISMKVKF